MACYGLLVRWWDGPPADDPAEALWLRFVEGRPTSGVTTQYLDRCCERLAAVGKAALPLVWDHVSWHVGREVAAWIAAHNRVAKATGEGTRIASCPLPVKSPWPNPIEPKWVHGTRRVVEPARLLTLDERETRVYDALGADQTDHLTMPKHAA